MDWDADESPVLLRRRSARGVSLKIRLLSEATRDASSGCESGLGCPLARSPGVSLFSPGVSFFECFGLSMLGFLGLGCPLGRSPGGSLVSLGGSLVSPGESLFSPRASGFKCFIFLSMLNLLKFYCCSWCQ